MTRLSRHQASPSVSAQPKRRIPLSRPWLDGREEELVLDVLRSGRLSLGPSIDRFEELFAERVGAPYAAAVSSGTAGLHLLTHSAGLGPGDEAITSPFSFVASANCAIYTGATPVFADVDPRTLNLDPAAVEAAITPRTKAVVAVDIFGYPCELEPLRELCERHGLVLIQDACEALGAEYRGAPVGSHGPSAVFAFYPNKQMTTGEGGVVTTHSEEEWQPAQEPAQPGPCRRRRLARPCAARLQLPHRRHPRRDRDRAAREARPHSRVRAGVARRYGELLAGVDVEPPFADDADHVRSWFVYVVKLPEGADRERVIAGLESRGVATSRYLPCIHLQSYMRERYGFAEGLCPVAEGIAKRTLALPFYAQLERDDQEYVVEALRAAAG